MSQPVSVIQKHGFTIDVQRIANGIWDMMPEDDKLPMVVGMIPKQWADMTERMLREKLTEEYAKQYDCTPAMAAAFLKMDKAVFNDNQSWKQFMAEIMHQFCLAMLHCAAINNVLKV